MLGFGSLLSSAFEGQRRQQWETVAEGSLKCYESCANPGQLDSQPHVSLMYVQGVGIPEPLSVSNVKASGLGVTETLCFKTWQASGTFSATAVYVSLPWLSLAFYFSLSLSFLLVLPFVLPPLVFAPLATSLTSLAVSDCSSHRSYGFSQGSSCQLLLVLPLPRLPLLQKLLVWRLFSSRSFCC